VFDLAGVVEAELLGEAGEPVGPEAARHEPQFHDARAVPQQPKAPPNLQYIF
jgi:hypothetical protein